MRELTIDQPFAGLVFKTISDPNGDLTFMRLYSGEMKQGEKYYNGRTRRFERVGRLMRMHAIQREPLDVAKAGDIVAVVGIKDAITGDTLSTKDNPVVYEAMTFPDTVISMAIEPQSAGDRDKLSSVIGKLVREDPTFKAVTDEQTGEMVISGMGELHLEVKCNQIKNDHKIGINVGKPKVAYKMTLKGPKHRRSPPHQAVGWFGSVRGRARQVRHQGRRRVPRVHVRLGQGRLGAARVHPRGRQRHRGGDQGRRPRRLPVLPDPRRTSTTARRTTWTRA